MKLLSEPIKRTSHFIQNPSSYQMNCDLCGGSHIEWSEYARMIWCYDCNIDTKGSNGIFGGPVPVTVAQVLGMSFDVYDMETKTIIPFEARRAPTKQQ